jgi:twitching motility two-component system response regulator PilH
MAIKKVMIVDDSTTDLLHLKEVVARSGCEIITATSGKEAVAKTKVEKPDLVFLDIVMDEMDGYRACREIKKDPETASIPVVFVSSKRQKADQLWAAKQGGRALISKPYTEDQILEQIKAVG